jgi:immune inhibitor A
VFARASALVLLVASPAAATMPTPAGTIPAEVRGAFSAGVLGIQPPPQPLGTSAVQSVWRVPILMIGFSDMPLTYSPAAFEPALFDTTGANPDGSATEYFTWVSEGRLRLDGRVVLVVQLPRPRDYYAFNAWGLNTIGTPNNIYGMVRDALSQAREEGMQVDWSHYDIDNDGAVDMLWVLHAGQGGETTPNDRNNVWSITSRLSSGWRLGSWFETEDLVPGSATQYIRIDRFATVPELSGVVPGARSEIGVYCHEFGHALGLPDLYDTSQLGGAANSGPGNWSLMATGSYGANGASPESPTHLGAWPVVFLGWRQTIRPATDALLSIAPLELGGDIVEFWFQGEASSEHFLIENRQPLGFDRNIPARGMILYQVDEAAIGARLQSNRVNAGLTPGLRLVEADGDSDLVVGRNRGDGFDPFPGGLQRRYIDEDTSPSTRTFRGQVTNLAIHDISNDTFDLLLRLQVQAPGWLPSEDRTTPDFAPIENGISPAFFIDDQRTTHIVRSELRAGRSQVILRSAQEAISAPPLQISHTTAVALDPAAVALPGGDLAVVWSDTRLGPARLFYRTRLRGTWSDEQAITQLPGDARNPSMQLSPDGTIHLSWLQIGPTSRVMFMRFLYSSPFGAAIAVTDSTQPGPPLLAMRPDGGSYLVWTERALFPSQIRFARFHPDSGTGPALPLAPLSFNSQSAPQAAFAPDGVLHAAWVESGSGTHRIRYQRREGFGLPEPTDQIVVQHGNAIESPALAVGTDGSTHLAYVRNHDGLLQTRYLRRREAYGWDLSGTNVSSATDGDATLPSLIVDDEDHVTVLFTAHPTAGARLFLKRRALGDAPPPVAVERPEPGPAGLILFPNPLRAGASLAIRRQGTDPEGIVDLFDLAGRRVESSPLGADGIPGFARIEPARTSRWAAGVYFARIRGDRGPAIRVVVLP